MNVCTKLPHTHNAVLRIPLTRLGRGAWLRGRGICAEEDIVHMVRMMNVTQPSNVRADALSRHDIPSARLPKATDDSRRDTLRLDTLRLDRIGAFYLSARGVLSIASCERTSAFS